MYLFFFFQAEDGIRDGRVTGVQTCALPISRWQGVSAESSEGDRGALPRLRVRGRAGASRAVPRVPRDGQAPPGEHERRDPETGGGAPPDGRRDAREGAADPLEVRMGMAMVNNAIVTENLTKVYGKLTAVDHVTLNVASGTFFGLLGPNGAGKTTMIKLLTGLTDMTE